MTNVLTKPKSRRSIGLPRKLSLATYFKLEEKSLQKNEFHNGLITPMAGGKLNHNLLAQQVGNLMGNFIFDNDFHYKVSNSDTKIWIDQRNSVVYPDAVVICEQPEYFEGRKDIITNPLIVIEVLSDSSFVYDRGPKFDLYHTIDSFKEYVLISQYQKQVSVFTKQTDGTWILRDYNGDDSTAILLALHNCPLPLHRLYRGIELA
jgi:Uma2 family endonuclease